MDENMRTYAWFASVVLAMTVGPALLLTLFICGVAATWNRYRDAITDKQRLKSARPAQIANSHN